MIRNIEYEHLTLMWNINNSKLKTRGNSRVLPDGQDTDKIPAILKIRSEMDHCSTDPNYKYISASNHSHLSAHIYEALDPEVHLTEEIFVETCREQFRKHLKKINKNGEVEYLFLNSYRPGFDLGGYRKETEEEHNERIELENKRAYETVEAITHHLSQFITHNNSLDDAALDKIIEHLQSKKTSNNKET